MQTVLLGFSNLQAQDMSFDDQRQITYGMESIYELRAKHVRVQYRILYFFHGQNVAILAHAITKETDQVPATDIERAIKRKHLFEANPEIHTYREDIENGED